MVLYFLSSSDANWSDRRSYLVYCSHHRMVLDSSCCWNPHAHSSVAKSRVAWLCCDFCFHYFLSLRFFASAVVLCLFVCLFHHLATHWSAPMICSVRLPCFTPSIWFNLFVCSFCCERISSCFTFVINAGTDCSAIRALSLSSAFLIFVHVDTSQFYSFNLYFKFCSPMILLGEAVLLYSPPLALFSLPFGI